MLVQVQMVLIDIFKFTVAFGLLAWLKIQVFAQQTLAKNALVSQSVVGRPVFI